MPSYVVRQGDCITSIAVRYGYSCDTIWNHPDNAQLKASRKNPNILLVGDVVELPDKPASAVSVPAAQRHRFVLKRPKPRLRLVLRDNGEPITNTSFELDIDGKTLPGTTDGNGKLDLAIPGHVTTAKLRMPARGRTWSLQIGHLDPIDEVTGAQARLKQLGFYAGAIDGALTPLTVAAIRSFQRKHQLAVTGTLDDATRGALAQQFGC
jgi:N-acetylmuramoyl-L-alanine amidase